MAAMDMDLGGASEGNLIYLSEAQSGMFHRCTYKCQIDHVCGNIFRCFSSNTTHICDMNCNQKIVYDNYSTICIMSKRISPHTASDLEKLRSIVCKRERNYVESCSSKRQTTLLSRKGRQLAICS